MFSAFHRHDGSRRVPVVWCGINQHIHFLVIEYFADIILQLWFVVDMFGKILQCFYPLLFHYITQVDQFHICILCCNGFVKSSQSATQAGYGNLNTVI
jgi:hypothetical protein